MVTVHLVLTPLDTYLRPLRGSRRCCEDQEQGPCLTSALWRFGLSGEGCRVSGDERRKGGPCPDLAEWRPLCLVRRPRAGAEGCSGKAKCTAPLRWAREKRTREGLHRRAWK